MTERVKCWKCGERTACLRCAVRDGFRDGARDGLRDVALVALLALLAIGLALLWGFLG